MLVPTLLEVGTDEQKQHGSRRRIRGDVIWCQGYSEPGAGSDLAVAADARRAAGRAFRDQRPEDLDQFGALRRHDVPAVPHRAGQAEARGISYLLLSMGTPGLEVRPLRTMTGRAEFNEVFFTDVRVPEGQIVLGRGKGWYVANVTLKHERSMIGDAEQDSASGWSRSSRC